MNLDQETNKRIDELQVLESQLQNFLMQKQSNQVELNEIENAVSELKKSDDEVYKIVSGIMIKAKKNSLNRELEERKKVLQSRIDAIEKQEKFLEKKASDLKRDISEAISKNREKKGRMSA